MGAARSAEVVGLTLALLAGAGGVAATQPGLARGLHASKAREDVYLFPPPEELKVATLGYRAAFVDVLWSDLRVQYGMHFVEKRPFPDVTHYLDAILGLEPDFAPVFRYVDTMVCYHHPQGTEADARTTRAYYERGIAARPNDHEVWLHYGQFLAFMSASYLTSQNEIDRWRTEGAAALARAVDLGDDPTRSLSAATLLSERGKRDAAVRALQRAYALTDDPATRATITLQLGQLEAADVSAKAADDAFFIQQRWGRWPFLDRGAFLLLGPAPDPLSCAGSRGADPKCATDWESALPSSQP
ncbi:MAG TPA: hypothetical protein VLM85_31155 [Polyangiaceae bacterium]|nr:hypothetical protein [Polyangiaceae bacterium]